jgi:fructuronate reductase
MTPVDVRAAVRLTRAALRDSGVAAEAPPVRIVHIGLGAFARSHLAWYTGRVDDAHEWGIAGFTGRSPAVAEQLVPQDGLYTLVQRSVSADEAEVVTSVVEVREAAEINRFVELVAAPSTAIVTLTVTESGYRLRPDGTPDTDDPAVAADLRVLAETIADPPSGVRHEYDIPSTALGRLVLGLAARRRAGAGPLAVVPCDNMPGNGALVQRGVVELARAASPADGDWIEQNIAFVSTSVDRITPRTTEADIAGVAAQTGWVDASPVVTEPFHDWILSGRFPAGRPEWERAGARFVEDIVPFERRKLWLLNGAHTLLAYAGLARGHRTVAEAVADPATRRETLSLWDEAAGHLPRDVLDLDRYLPELLGRFENARIEHHLAQIAGEGVTKLRVRIVPVAVAERRAGRTAAACAVPVGAWIALVVGGVEFADAQSDAVASASAAPDPVRALVAVLDDARAGDDGFVERVRGVAEEFAQPMSAT